jgi:hypothetical protein
VGNRTVEDTIAMVQGKDRYGLLHTWEVAEALPMVEVIDQGPLGAAFAGSPMSAGRYPALPGRYTFRATEHPVLTAPDVPVVVTTDRVDGPPQILPEMKPGVIEEAERAVVERIESCARSTELPADGCPFFTDRWYMPDLTDVKIRITTMPTFSFIVEGSSGGLIIQTETEGELSLTGTETVPSFFSEPAQPRPYEHEFTFTVNGSVTGSGQDLVVEFEDW